jgi:hypothetical protein
VIAKKYLTGKIVTRDCNGINIAQRGQKAKNRPEAAFSQKL